VAAVTLATLDVAAVATVTTTATVATEGARRAGRTGVHATKVGAAVAGVSAADHDHRTLASSMTVGRGSRCETDAKGTQRTCQ
jgi:hypothetical protein